MCPRDGAEIRRERLQILLNLVESNENNPNMTERRIKAIFMLRTGLTRRKIDEYVEDVISTGFVKRDGEYLLYNN